MKLSQAAVRNILTVRNDRFGEFLLNIPALRALKESFPNSEITCVVSSATEEISQFIPYINETIVWDKKSHVLADKLKLLKLLRAKRFDIAVMLNPQKEFNLFSFLSGIPLRLGYNRKWGCLLTHKIKDYKYREEKHEIDYNLELVGLIGAKTENKTLSLEIESDIINKFSRQFSLNNADFITLHPWTSDPLKQWALKNFKALAKSICDELKLEVLIVGSGIEAAETKNLFDSLGKNIINLTGKTSLLQLAVILKKSKLLISADSGPVHLAGAVNTPVIALFRDDLAGKTAKRWGPADKCSAVIEGSPLSKITPEEVLNKIKEILKFK